MREQEMRPAHEENDFEALVMRHQTALLRMCYVILQDRGMAEDAVQETLMKAYRGWSAFRGESSEGTWLTRIAINVCKDIRRRKWWRMRPASLETLPEAAVACEAQDETILLTVMHLPLRQREVVLLYYVREMTLAEIAEALGLSVSAVGGRLARARRTLKALWEGDE